MEKIQGRMDSITILIQENYNKFKNWHNSNSTKNNDIVYYEAVDYIQNSCIIEIRNMQNLFI